MSNAVGFCKMAASVAAVSQTIWQEASSQFVQLAENVQVIGCRLPPSICNAAISASSASASANSVNFTLTADLEEHVLVAADLATAAGVVRVSCCIKMLPKFQVHIGDALTHISSLRARAGAVLDQRHATRTCLQAYTDANVLCSDAASTSGRQGATPAAPSAAGPGSNAGAAGGASGGSGGLPGSRIGSTSRLFENVKPIAAEEAASSSSSSEAASEPGAAMRALTSLGNTAFLGLLGAGTFFGYYTVKYDTETLQTVVQETHKEENQFVGSSVRHFLCQMQA